ncbi:MAG TPA: hemerythrin domain-containing protein [Candidatus Limnocylindrales bacterium]
MADMQGAPQAVWAFTEHEHRDIVRGIDHIHDVACEIGGWVTPELAGRLLDVLRWIERDLEPHIAWEEAWLYPQIDARTGTPWATRSARFDHRQIRDMTARFRTDQAHIRDDAHERVPDLRCHLFGLEALLRAHIDREERYLIPMLADDASMGVPSTPDAIPEGSGRATARAG